MDAEIGPRRLVLPPPYRQHWLPGNDVMAEACRRAPGEGAGTLVWRHAPGAPDGAAAGLLDFAVVLEPEEPLAGARRAFLAGMVALCDALAAHCPPERPVRVIWPGEVVLDAGRLGGARLAVAPGTSEGDVPHWLVFCAELFADRDFLADPGLAPGSISLKEEEIADPAAVVESFAAHLMLSFDRWKHGGFEAIGARYADRLGPGASVTPDGDLRREDGVSPLAAGLASTLWRGAEGPIL